MLRTPEIKKYPITQKVGHIPFHNAVEHVDEEQKDHDRHRVGDIELAKLEQDLLSRACR